MSSERPPDSTPPEFVEMPVEMGEVDRRRVEGIAFLLASPDGASYRQRLREVSESLGISARSMRRLVQRWREAGLPGVVRPVRSDRGASRLCCEWQSFIIETWRWGNREGRRMNPSQVAVRVKARAAELGEACPSHTAVYRLLKPEIEKHQRQVPKIGWRGTRLELLCKSGERLAVECSNQVWQVDHTLVDVLVVDEKEALSRPWLTTVIDSYSRCIVGYHLGMESPSADTVCLALRQAILPKQLPSSWEVSVEWQTYGLPQYLYTDGGQEFRSRRLIEAATHLGIGLEQRQRPSEGGIVERPFGTFNTELFATLPGYTGAGVHERPVEAQISASLRLMDLERLLVRYIVERYNRLPDARARTQTRLNRWEVGLLREPLLPNERDLDICLMRRERRRVYQGGHLRFMGLVYRGECLGIRAGEEVTLRCDPRDVRSLLIYTSGSTQEVFLGMAQALDISATESLSLSQARAMGRQAAAAGRRIIEPTVLSEVRRRDQEIAASKKKQTTPSERKATQKPSPSLPPRPSAEPIVAKSPPVVPVAAASVLAQITRLQKLCILELDRLRALHEWLKDKQITRRACRVVGEPLTGKTIACDLYRLLQPVVQRPGALPLIPVVRVQLPVACSPSALFTAILEALRYPLTTVNLVHARERVCSQLTGHGVEMLIIDTSEHLELQTFADVCDLHERLNIAVVLVGTETLEIVMRRLERPWRHFAACHYLGRLSSEELLTTSIIWERQVLRLPGASGLHRPAIQRVLGAATGGYVGLLDPILRESAVRALRRGMDHIDLCVLEEVALEYQGR
jgi:putative transposase